MEKSQHENLQTFVEKKNENNLYRPLLPKLNEWVLVEYPKETYRTKQNYSQ